MQWLHIEPMLAVGIFTACFLAGVFISVVSSNFKPLVVILVVIIGTLTAFGCIEGMLLEPLFLMAGCSVLLQVGYFLGLVAPTLYHRKKRFQRLGRLFY